MRLRRAAILGVGVVVLVGVADRGLRVAAEHRLAKQTSCRLDAAHSSVEIGGFLLGPQIVRNRYSHVTVHSTGVHEPDGLVDLTADLHDVRHVSDRTLRAGHGEVTVTVPFSTVAAQAGPHITASEADGQLVFSSDDETNGTGGSTVYANVSLVHDSVIVTPVRVFNAGAPVPLAKAKAIAARAGLSLDPRRTPLPSSLTSLGLRSATATAAGLQLQAAGPDLTITLPNVPGC